MDLNLKWDKYLVKLSTVFIDCDLKFRFNDDPYGNQIRKSAELIKSEDLEIDDNIGQTKSKRPETPVNDEESKTEEL